MAAAGNLKSKSRRNLCLQTSSVFASLAGPEQAAGRAELPQPVPLGSLWSHTAEAVKAAARAAVEATLHHNVQHEQAAAIAAQGARISQAADQAAECIEAAMVCDPRARSIIPRTTTMSAPTRTRAAAPPAERLHVLNSVSMATAHMFKSALMTASPTALEAGQIVASAVHTADLLLLPRTRQPGDSGWTPDTAPVDGEFVQVRLEGSDHPSFGVVVPMRDEYGSLHAEHIREIQAAEEPVLALR